MYLFLTELFEIKFGIKLPEKVLIRRKIKHPTNQSMNKNDESKTHYEI